MAGTHGVGMTPPWQFFAGALLDYAKKLHDDICDFQVRFAHHLASACACVHGARSGQRLFATYPRLGAAGAIIMA